VTANLRIRCANTSDLPFINAVINAALTTWPISPRAQRLFTEALTYDAVDLRHFEMFVCVHDDQVVGIAAWDPHNEPSLFHGLYVTPDYQRRGAGAGLMNTVVARARTLGKDGLLVKSARASVSYFEALSLERIHSSGDSDYPYSFWCPVTFTNDRLAPLNTPI